MYVGQDLRFKLYYSNLFYLMLSVTCLVFDDVVVVNMRRMPISQYLLSGEMMSSKIQQ